MAESSIPNVRIDDEKVEHFKRAYDSCCDGKGKMNKRKFKEFFLMKHVMTLDDSHPSLFVFLDHVFDAFDEKRKGYLTFNDIIINLDKICYGSTHEKLRGVFKICDNKKRGKIEEKDFITLCQCFAFVRDDSLMDLTKKARRLYKKSLDGFSTCPQYMDQEQFVELMDSDPDVRYLTLEAIYQSFFAG